MASALKATGVCHSYGKDAAKREVLKDFELELASQSFDVLMGPSGSGKSTFLHLAAGLISANGGNILIGGKDVTRMSDSEAARYRRRHVGVVFQSFNLLDALSVEDNIALPVKLDHGKVDKVRLARLIERLGIEKCAKKSPAELSGGERQRVAIARALFAEPDVILADEPTGNLDAVSARGICELLKEINVEEKSAILLVTHDPLVASVAKRVHFLKGGRIVKSFDPQGDPAVISKFYVETYG